MIKVENIKVHGFEPAIRGMRNPMNSWDKIDSDNCILCDECNAKDWCNHDDINNMGQFVIGPNDLNLMQRLYNGGKEHRKYARYIDVYMDITAPLYWWKEWDTYKFIVNPIDIDSNSCSTMHKIHSKEFELDDFSHEHLSDYSISHALEPTIDVLNHQRGLYLKDKSKTWWWQLIQLLPSSYNQKRTVKLTYEGVFDIINQRSNHKLDEWRDLVKILKELPYVQDIMIEEL